MNTRSPEADGNGTHGPSWDGNGTNGANGSAGPGSQSALCDYLSACKVAELQEMWGFWENGTRPPRRKQELLDPLLESLRDETKVRARIKILSARPREVLLRLVRSDEYRAALPDLVTDGSGRDIEPYEVEAAARALAKRGFVQILRGATGGRGHELYAVPHDLGDLISSLLQEERRGPRQIFSLDGHLAALGHAALRRAAALTPGRPAADPEAVSRALLEQCGADELLRRVEDEGLRNAVRTSAVEHGGIVPWTRFQELAGDRDRDRAETQTLLEDLGLGTITSLALGDYGVDLGGQSVILFFEVVERLLDAAAPQDGPAHDSVDAARVDLLTDLQQLLHLVATTPLRVTQGRTIYRAAQHRILQAFTFCEDALMDHRRVFDLLYDLAFRLELVEVTDESRLKLTRRGQGWDSENLTAKVAAIYERFLDERLPEGRDFHVRRLRRAVAKALEAAPADRFIPLDDVPFRVRNDYLAVLEEEGVKDLYRNRFQYTYTPPRETPDDLKRGLADYVISRLYPLGMVDVALLGEQPVGLRLTRMGRRLLRGERLEQDAAEDEAEVRSSARPLVVNPDFEVVLFPEGNVNEIAHALNRFASRTKAEEVSLYRITRDGVERAVVKGMDAEEILLFLSEHSRAPVPQNVEYSIREWAARVSFAWQRDVVLLTTSDAEAMDRVLQVEDVKRLLIDRVSPTAAAMRARITDWKVRDLLRSMGVYFP